MTALQRIQETIAANSTLTLQKPGGFLFVVSSSDDFTLQFDSGDSNDAIGGFYFRQSFQKITLTNSTSEDVDVDMFIGDASMSFIGAFETRVASTYAKGNFGISNQAELNDLVNGYISSANVGRTNGGSGYKVGDILSVAGGTGTAATIKVNTVNYSGQIINVSVLFPGSYTAVSGISGQNSVTGGSGSGATISLKIVSQKSGLTVLTGGWLKLSSGNSLSPYNFDGANRRKQITFRTLSTSSGSLAVYDLNGCLFAIIAPGNVETYETSAAFIIQGVSSSGANADATFVINELFYGTQP